MLGRRDGHQRADALAQAASAQAGDAVLGGHHVHVAARGGYRPRQAADDLRVALLAAGGQGDDGHATLGLGRRAYVVNLSAYGADIVAADGLGIHLAGQVHFQRRVDRDEFLQSRQCADVVRVARRTQANLRVAMREVVQPLGAEQHAAHGHARVDALVRVGDNAALHQFHHRVADHSRVDAELTPVQQHAHDGFGYGADTHLQRGAVVNQVAQVMRDAPLQFAKWGRRQLQRGAVGG